MDWFSFEISTFLLVFIILNIVNVVIQTVKSIVTINGSRWSAAAVNAVAYGLYTVVVIYMNIEGLGILWKALIIGFANLVGVYAVKLFEEKSRKDRLWKVETTLLKDDFKLNEELLRSFRVPHYYIDINKYVILNFYCANKKQSEIVKGLLADMNAKYFVSESKML